MKKNQLKNIAILTDNFPPCSGGGIAEWALGVAESLVAMNYKVNVLSRWRKQVGTSDHDQKDYELTCMFGRDWNTYRYWYVLYNLWKFLKKNPRCIVIATTWELGSPMVFLRRFFPQANLVIIAHGREVTKLKSAKELKTFEKTIRHAVLTIAVSRFTKEEILNRLSTNNSSVEFLPNAVNIDRFYPVKDFRTIQNKLGVNKRNKVILTLARVIERKGHDTVIKALPDIIKQYPETIYVIAGPWKEPFYQKLQTLIDDLDLREHVVFSSFVSDEDLTKYYSMSDVYVMVSRELEKSGDSEGFGITFLEANACHCPVIGSYSGGIPDAIEDGVSGYLIEPDDPKALSQKILLLFNDQKLRDEMAIRGRKRVEDNYTWQKITLKLINHIENSLQQVSH